MKFKNRRSKGHPGGSIRELRNPTKPRVPEKDSQRPKSQVIQGLQGTKGPKNQQKQGTWKKAKGSNERKES